MTGMPAGAQAAVGFGGHVADIVLRVFGPVEVTVCVVNVDMVGEDGVVVRSAGRE